MKPWKILGRAPGEEGKELVLSEHDGVFVIRAGGMELMSSARHGSEEAMAEVAFEQVESPAPVMLIGGLGLGYTLRATLDRMPPEGTVVVAEISKAVAEWNRGPLKALHQDALSDPRVHLDVTDVAKVIANRNKSLDAIMLDNDNGPTALCLRKNQELYEYAGLARAHQALKANGALIIWSAGTDAHFLKRLAEVGFDVSERAIPKRPGTRATHMLYIGRKIVKRR